MDPQHRCAINVISRKPEFEFDGYLKFDYSTYEDEIVEGGFGGPIWDDKLAARGAFHYEDPRLEALA